jgi:hypothetical protein
MDMAIALRRGVLRPRDRIVVMVVVMAMSAVTMVIL